MVTRDPYGDPRDYLAEVQQILQGQLPLSPTLAHCQALLAFLWRRS